MNTLLLIPGNYYHIYNCGINGENLFKEMINYEYFIKLYEKYIPIIAHTYAWCLMPNHFHLLVQIKDPSGLSNPSGFQNLTGLEKVKPPHQYFSNLFNAYTKAINKRYQRHGALFERPFKRKLIDNHRYFTNVVMYIHNNPIHHGFTDSHLGWGWSSYLSCISNKPTKLQKDTVINWFGSVHSFKQMHDNEMDKAKIEAWLEL